MRTSSICIKHMKYLLFFILFLGVIAPSQADYSILSNQSMEDGCKRGAQDGSEIAVLYEQAMVEILNSTTPESAKRQAAIKRIIDISRKKEDAYNDKIEKEQERWITRSESDISDFYKRQIFKSNVKIRFMAMQSAFGLAVKKGLENAVGNISSSESRYRREIENECIIIYSSK